MTNAYKTVSPQDIVITAPPAVLLTTDLAISGRMSDKDFANFKRGVEEMLEACTEANLNERLVNVITACIGAGFTTAGAIIKTAATFGFKTGHVGSVLSSSAAGKSKKPNWGCDADKQYSLLS